MRGQPGTTCKISYDLNARTAPEEGDFLRTESGTCYMVDVARQSPTLDRVYLTCTRLDVDAVYFGDPGVHPLYWNPRNPRPKVK
jgi:hypothetical protein